MTITAASSRNTRSPIVWGGAGMLLLLPAIAMLLTTGMQWTALDFVAWAAMLATASGGYELLARQAPDGGYRAGAAVALLAAFLLVWIDLAVGIIGSEQDDANLMFAGVLTVAVAGVCLARLRSGGMARAMMATAGVQVLVAAIAVALGLGSDGPVWPRDVLGVTAMLTTLWLASAGLFRRSARPAGARAQAGT